MSDNGSTCSNGGQFMAANAPSRLELNVNAERTNGGCAPTTLKQRFGKLLRKVFEGHEEYLGVTPDS
jgi:hypothetical protein